MSSCRRFAWVTMGLALASVAVTHVFAENDDFMQGSKRIAARIDAILATQDPIQAAFRNVERAAALRKIVTQLETEAPNSPNHVTAVFTLALELLRAGEMEESLEYLE